MLIKVKCFPSSKKEEVIEKNSDSFEVYLKVKPERGEANKRVFALLADFLNISQNKLRIIKGTRERNKIFEIIEK